MATNTLDPQLLAQILGLQSDPANTRGMDGNRVTRYIAPEGDPLADYQLVNRQQQQFAGPNEEGAWSPGQNYIYKDIKQDGLIDIFDDKGNFLSREKGANPGNELAQVIALMAGGYYGGNYLAGANGAQGATTGLASGATGSGGGGMVNGAFLGEGVASGVPAWDAAAMSSALGSGQLGTAASYLGQTMQGGTALETLGSALTPTSATSALNGATNVAKTVGGGGSLLGGALGAVAGAIDGQDKTQTSSRDPWAPAQDFLKQRLSDGTELAAQYKQQPFSQAQQTAYGNVGGILDLVNGQLPGLLAGMNANASMQNQFVRGQRPTLTGSTFNASGYTPAGLLGAMGSK